MVQAAKAMVIVGGGIAGLTQRSDTAFRRDNVDTACLQDRLKELLTLWKYQSPWFYSVTSIA